MLDHRDKGVTTRSITVLTAVIRTKSKVTGCEYLSQSSAHRQNASACKNTACCAAFAGIDWCSLAAYQQRALHCRRLGEQLEELTCPTAEEKGKVLVSMLQRLAPQEADVAKNARQLSQVT